MNISQILVRSMIAEKLRQFKHDGLKHGKFILVTPIEIENELTRRYNNSRGNHYLQNLYR